MKRHLYKIFLLTAAMVALAEPLPERPKAYITTTAPATVELYEHGKMIGTAVIPPNTDLLGHTLPDGNFMADYLRGQARVLRKDTNLVPPPSHFDFERLETKLGGVYHDVRVIKRNPAEIMIDHADGSATLPIDTLSLEVQRSLKYDPKEAADYLEHRRTEAAQRAEAARSLAAAANQARAAKRSEKLSVPEPVVTTRPEERVPESPKTEDETSVMAGKLWNALVAKSPARLFVANLDPKHADSRAPTFGKDARPGDFLAEVPSGFFVIGTQCRDSVGGVVELPLPIKSNRFAYVYSSDFAHIGIKGWRKWWDDGAISAAVIPYPFRARFIDLKPNPQTELLDIYKRYRIASNRTGAFQKVLQLTADAPPKATGEGLVKTPAGWFFGYLTERNPVPVLNISWEQVLNPAGSRWFLKMEKSQDVPKGTLLFRLADFESTHRNISPRTAPEKVRITPAHYAVLVQSGIPGLLAEMEDSHAADACNLPISKPESVSEPHPMERDVVVKELALKFVEWTTGRTLLEVLATQNEREIERHPDSNWVEAKPWKMVKASDFQWIANDPDGGLRLTDGRFVYEIIPDGALNKPKLKSYSVMENEVWKVKNNEQ